jgi:hypothetical protein
MVPLASGAFSGETSGVSHAREQRRAFRDDHMKQVLSEPVKHPVVYALAALYTGKDQKGGNKQLRDELAKIAGIDKKFSPTESGDSKVKWCMRGWLRVYYLFSDKSRFFPGRLEKDVQASLEEMFFNYGAYKSTVERASLRNIWHIHESENHDLMDFSNAYLALQAVKNLDAYKDRKLPDKHTPGEHVAAWHKYYAQYCLERAKNGLFIEISPSYGKWFVGEFVNMFQFSEDPLVRRRMEMLLHLMWADWSVDQLNGIRGGGKTRCYQGSYSQSGAGDSWDRMAGVLFGIEPSDGNSHGDLSTLALQTSPYQLPEVVLDIALNKGSFEPFIYQSTRPGKVLKSPKGIYVMDPKAGGILRYSYSAPEAVMGSWMLDTRTEYAAIHKQNRWQGVIFPTGRDVRVFPQSEGTGNGKTYQQHIAVQHRNVMLVTNHPKAEQTAGLRVFIAERLHKGLKEQDGWAIVKEGNAWLGVRPLDAGGYDLKALEQKKVEEASRQNLAGTWLWPKSKDATVVLVLSREAKHKTFAEFLSHLKSHKFASNKGVAEYTFTDDLGAEVKLELGKSLNIPLVDGKPVNLNPQKVFDSPYLSSDHGSGIVTIQKGEQKKVLNFNQTGEE